MMDTIYLREKLAKLRLCGVAPFSSDFRENQPIFSADEISNEPLKWLKYLVMDRIGVEPIKKVAAQINRFSLTNIETAKTWVLSRFAEHTCSDTTQMVVAKVVPWDSGAQLKNYRMFSTADVERAFEQLADDFPGSTYELWCCESPVGTRGLNLGGRINYPRAGGEQVLELVWFASPRLIESVTLPDFHYPYLRAVRTATNPAFSIDVLHVPAPYFGEQTPDTWQSDFRWVAQELELKRSAMHALVNTLKDLGAKEVCFCFKMMEERLTIIDWDSEVESTDVK